MENVADSAIAQLLVNNQINAFEDATLFFDASGDGVAETEIRVTTARQCITIRPILNDALNIDDIAATGVSGIALITAITQAPDPDATTTQLLSILQENQERVQ